MVPSHKCFVFWAEPNVAALHLILDDCLEVGGWQRVQMK